MSKCSFITPTLILFALILAISGITAYHYDPSLITTDVAQYRSVAKNILAGNGLKTNLIFYEQHLVFGTLPVPQAIWPPGFPIIIAGLAAIGVPLIHAPFLMALISNGLISLLLYAILRATARSKRTAFLAAASWMLFVPSTDLVLASMSDVPFTMATVASMTAFVFGLTARNRFTIVCAGVLAALALLLRYTGLFYVAALTLSLAVLLALRNRKGLWVDSALSLMPSLIVATGLMWRNYLLVGSAAGRLTVEDRSSLILGIKYLYWETAKMLGFSIHGLQSDFIILALAGLGLLTISGFVTHARSSEHTDRDCTLFVVFLSTVYIGIASSSILYLSVNQQLHFSDARYLVPLTPFAIIIISFGIERLLRSLERPKLRAATAVASAFCISIVMSGQLNVLKVLRANLDGDEYYHAAVAFLSRQYGESTFGAFLKTKISPNSPLLMHDGQLMGELLDRPVVGLPHRRLSGRIFDTEEVRLIVCSYNTGHGLIFPKYFLENPVNSNKPFFADLVQGFYPHWVKPIVYEGELILFEIILNKACDE